MKNNNSEVEQARLLPTERPDPTVREHARLYSQIVEHLTVPNDGMAAFGGFAGMLDAYGILGYVYCGHDCGLQVFARLKQFSITTEKLPQHPQESGTASTTEQSQARSNE